MPAYIVYQTLVWNIYRKFRSMMRQRHLKFNQLAFIFALFMGFNAVAQPLNSSTYHTQKKTKNSDDAGASLGFELSGISYSSGSAVDSNFQEQAELNLRYKKDGLFFSDTKINFGTFSEPQSVYYAFPEAYVGYGDSKNAISAGRKHESLSFADSFFNFGMIQGHSTNDNINFTESGLTGISYHLESDDFGMIAEYNPIFIPNQGPAIKAENGKIVSSNRWAQQPPDHFKFGNQNKEIVYAIRDYNISDIVMNSGYLASVYLGSQINQRPLLQFTYAQQPVNELALSRDTFGDIATFKGYVYLTPIVLTHEVQAADLNLDSGRFKSTISVLADKPSNKVAIELEAMQTLSPVSIVSVYSSYDLSSAARNLEMYAAVAEISGGDIKDLTRDGKDASFSFASGRTLFKKPVRLGVKGDLFYVLNEAVNADMNLTYDQQFKGSLMSVKFKYQISKGMNLNFGADLIGVEDDNNPNETNFLAQNKANDRIYGGLTYVF